MKHPIGKTWTEQNCKALVIEDGSVIRYDINDKEDMADYEEACNRVQSFINQNRED